MYHILYRNNISNPFKIHLKSNQPRLSKTYLFVD